LARLVEFKSDELGNQPSNVEPQPLADSFPHVLTAEIYLQQFLCLRLDFIDHLVKFAKEIPLELSIFHHPGRGLKLAQIRRKDLVEECLQFDILEGRSTILDNPLLDFEKLRS